MRMVCSPGGQVLESCRRYFLRTRWLHARFIWNPLPCLDWWGIDVFTVINTAILAAAICLAIAGVYVLRGPNRRQSRQ